MAGPLVFLLALIGWQAAHVEPLYRPAFQTAVRSGEQLFPIGVPPLAERRVRGGQTSRRSQLDAVSVAPTDEADTECAAFVRVSRNHWRRYALAPADRVELGLADIEGLRLDGEVGERHASIAVADVVDDDDGDGRRLDAGELRPASVPGVEVEIACRSDEITTP